MRMNSSEPGGIQGASSYSVGPAFYVSTKGENEKVKVALNKLTSRNTIRARAHSILFTALTLVAEQSALTKQDKIEFKQQMKDILDLIK